MYGKTFRFLEVTNLVMIVFSSWLLVWFFGEGAHLYGIELVEYFMQDQSINNLPIQKPNPSYKFFPLLAKCQYNFHGAGGDIQVKVTGLCWIWKIIFSECWCLVYIGNQCLISKSFLFYILLELLPCPCHYWWTVLFTADLF